MNFILKTATFSLILLLSATASLAQKNTGSVKGKVRSADGDRISDVAIKARQNGKNLRSSKTNKKGEFRINGLSPGRYNLVFEKHGFSVGVLYNVLVKKRKVNNLKDRLILTVDQGTLVIINGSVFNQFGQSIYGAKIKIEEVRSGKSARKAGRQYTSRSGQFTFRFPEGKKKFLVTATAKKVTVAKEIEVEEAAIYRMAITLTLPEKSR